MKKIAGIALVVSVLVGAPLAWHYHSPIPFLPAFSGNSASPPAELAFGLEEEEPSSSPASDEETFGSIPPPADMPWEDPPTGTPATSGVPGQFEEVVFTLEASTASPEMQIQDSPAGYSMDADIPPPLPALQ